MHHLVLSQYTHLTDGQTDGRTEFRQQYCALHYMQSHGKTYVGNMPCYRGHSKFVNKIGFHTLVTLYLL